MRNALILLATIAGCASSPASGEREVTLVDVDGSPAISRLVGRRKAS